MADALYAIQQRFLAAIMGEDVDAEALIVDDARVGAARRIGIYRNNYRASLTGVLADHFERLHAYLGDAQFGHIADAYVKAHPSTTRNLRYYGAALPDFVAHHFQEDGELAELARLDWALRHAFDAPDTPPLDAGAIGMLGEQWVGAGLALHPSARLLAMDHNSAALWSALDAGEAPPAVAVLAAPVDVLVWRNGLQPHFRSLAAVEAATLVRIGRGASFADISAHLVNEVEEATAMETLAALLARWLADGVLILADQAAAVT
ncbi:HvfC/BufC N-terminal domain-containing protein [Sphingopyxis sp. A083]|uniref:HvfC/BufC N-terminal domain-containing protein n=1 Tax=Sphingopyxis sp. A083 TaxID=1759083 RepID=UPI00073BE655|nr:DNA-binding domain-containing protein [Sphingopyxis sp. A083]KTE75523.1 hypothetical protein ATE59_12710 [Sphingopyxis sp. A083]